MSTLKKIIVSAVFVLFFLSSFDVMYSQGPKGKNLGIGIVLGDPTGLTLKYWLNSENALNFDLGSSYFGSTRLDVDYMWHFNAFNSKVVMMTASIGGVLGFGYNDNDWVWHKKKGDYYWHNDDDFGLGVKAAIGLNIIPKRTPLEIFANLGVLVGVVPGFGSDVEACLGIRFYP